MGAAAVTAFMVVFAGSGIAVASNGGDATILFFIAGFCFIALVGFIAVAALSKPQNLVHEVHFYIHHIGELPTQGPPNQIDPTPSDGEGEGDATS